MKWLQIASYDRLTNKKRDILTQLLQSCPGAALETLLFSSKGEGWDLKGLGGVVIQHQTDSYLPHQLAEEWGDFIEKQGYNGILIHSYPISTEVVGQLSHRLNRSGFSGAILTKWTEEQVVFQKTAYNNNLSAQLTATTPWVLSLAEGAHSLEKIGENLPEITVKTLETPLVLGKKPTLIQGKDDMTASPVLVAVGKGIATQEEVGEIRAYAQANGYAFGVTRPVAMQGWGKISEIIGISGSIYTPEICITLGVSGSAAFSVGVEQSSWILAVNTNPNAPILTMSDVAVVADYRTIWPELQEEIRHKNS